MNKQGVVSLGDAFIDFISLDQTNTSFQPLLGGATVNVAVWIGRLGVSSYYLCKLGTDDNSLFIEKELKKEQVNIKYCRHSPDKKICSVHVNINQNGDRYFHTYDNPTPDELLTADELEQELFQRTKIFYFGSGTLFHETARNTTLQALDYARQNQTVVAFDTNIRLKRWESEEVCRETIGAFLKKADIVKMSLEELYFLTRTSTMNEALRQLSAAKIPYLFITMGSNGASAIHAGKRIDMPGLKVRAIDTTGAGDAFMAAILNCFHQNGFPMDEMELKTYLEFANRYGAIAAMKIGSL